MYVSAVCQNSIIVKRIEAVGLIQPERKLLSLSGQQDEHVKVFSNFKIYIMPKFSANTRLGKRLKMSTDLSKFPCKHAYNVPKGLEKVYLCLGHRKVQ